mmetsp:Transcript_4027/g.13543  ORF Transcript_4027/g.13543 Transcript_4027/m.13543 type:complete len:258 (-) Transcript_4027:1255-2028(-)
MPVPALPTPTPALLVAMPALLPVLPVPASEARPLPPPKLPEPKQSSEGSGAGRADDDHAAADADANASAEGGDAADVAGRAASSTFSSCPNPNGELVPGRCRVAPEDEDDDGALPPAPTGEPPSAKPQPDLRRGATSSLTGASRQPMPPPPPVTSSSFRPPPPPPPDPPTPPEPRLRPEGAAGAVLGGVYGAAPPNQGDPPMVAAGDATTARPVSAPAGAAVEGRRGAATNSPPAPLLPLLQLPTPLIGRRHRCGSV